MKAISGAATAVLISVWLKVPAEVLASWWADAEEDGGPAAPRGAGDRLTATMSTSAHAITTTAPAAMTA